MKITKPAEESIPEYYRNYVAACAESDLIESLQNGLNEFIFIARSIPYVKENYSYTAGKWSIKEVMLHMIDSERVFSYRAMTFSRKDSTPLPGFEENDYAINSNAENRSIISLQKEFETLRLSNIEMFNGMTGEMLELTGTANDNKMSVCAIGWMMSGHSKHHVNVIKEKYLQ
jgi:hypothetical protein